MALVIVDQRWSAADDDFQFKVTAWIGHGNWSWKFEDEIAADIVADWKSRHPDWTKCELCRVFVVDGDDMEGWTSCSRCSAKLCEDCESTTWSLVGWRSCYVEGCYNFYCGMHALRITTPNAWHSKWCCCVPLMEQQSSSGEQPELIGWNVQLPPLDFVKWETDGWLDADHPNGLILERYI